MPGPVLPEGDAAVRAAVGVAGAGDGLLHGLLEDGQPPDHRGAAGHQLVVVAPLLVLLTAHTSLPQAEPEQRPRVGAEVPAVRVAPRVGVVAVFTGLQLTFFAPHMIDTTGCYE